MKASYIKPGTTILVNGDRLVVRNVEPTHKDAVCIRLRGRAPLYRRWDDEVDVADRPMDPGELGWRCAKCLKVFAMEVDANIDRVEGPLGLRVMCIPCSGRPKDSE
jgi:hypothetical protein